tara:strand:+ start:33623 stop:33970 length:348 start_codon:yes stop_codon:yes gene_type:complete
MAKAEQKYREKMNKASKSLAMGMGFYGKQEDFGFSSKVAPTSLEDRLRIAIMVGSSDTVDKTLSLGADANAISANGHSMLELAEAYNPELIALLKTYGAEELPSKSTPKSTKSKS